MSRFTGKVALITGAARGQGRSHAVRLAAEGADIIAVDHCQDLGSVPYPLASTADLDETARLVRETGRRVVASVADVRDFAQLSAAVDAGVTELGRLDIVVANAGIFSVGDAVSLSEEAWDDMIDINLTGVWKTAKAAIPHLRTTGDGGSIINIGSTASSRPYVGLPHYVAAKHGVIGLTKALAKELAPEMIRVNAVLPTNVDTDMIQNEATYKLFLPDLEAPTRDDFALPARDLQEMPRSWIEVGDVSAAVLFLASSEARYITGAALPVDLGALLK